MVAGVILAYGPRMDAARFDEILLETWDDHRLSRSEKKALAAIFADYHGQPQRLAFFRHRAFELARRVLPSSRGNEVLDWLEEVLKALAQAQSGDGPTLAEAHFSPGDDCQRRIVSLVAHARRTIDACVFTITDNRIALALLEAHHRGVRVRIITDDEKAEDRGSDIHDLAAGGIPIRTDRSENHMHHKFAIFDRAFLLTGSYNWTRSAAALNEENIVVTNDDRLLRAFETTFDKLWCEFV